MTGSKGEAKGNLQGKRLIAIRKFTLAGVFVAVLASLAFDSGIGTPSTFGIGEFFLLCPLGGLEALLASKSFIPVAAISMAAVVLFSLVFGRSWCAWGCPAPVIRKFFKRSPNPLEANPSNPTDEYRQANEKAVSHEAASGCSTRAALRHIVRDTRSWTLVAVLVAALVAGFPLFCLICPIGLTFGTVGSLWHLIVDKQMTASVVVFPAALLLETVAYRRWCLNLCPIAGLLGLFGQFAKIGRPKVDTTTCLRHREGASCTVCKAACTECIDLHAPDASIQLGGCTRCGECAAKCPTASITLR